MICESLGKNVAIIPGTTDHIHLRHLFFYEQQQSVTKAIGATRELAVVVTGINFECKSSLFDAVLVDIMTEIPQPGSNQTCYQGQADTGDCAGNQDFS